MRRRSPVTRALHRRIGREAAVTPLYQTSAFRAGSRYFYTRKNNPNVEELERTVSDLEEAPHAVAVSTGMAAITAAAGLLRPGDRVVLNRLGYGCTQRQFRRLEERLGLRVELRDLTQPCVLAPDTAMVFFETPTNPFLRTVPIAEVRRRAPGALVVVDNTWATPLFQHPLAHGADLSLHSATKFISGHADVMGGLLLTRDAALAARLREERFYGGAILDPHSAWLLRRSLQTFALRMREHARVTETMAAFLETLPQIARVYRPAVDGRQLTGYGGILFCDLRPDLARRYGELARGLRLFRTGTAMACVTSMVAQPVSGSHASLTRAEQRAMGLSPGLVRLCFGLEDVADLQHDLRRALRRIERRDRCVRRSA